MSKTNIIEKFLCIISWAYEEKQDIWSWIGAKGREVNALRIGTLQRKSVCSVTAK